MDINLFRKELLLSAQRALLGLVYPSIRAIAIGFEGEKKLLLTCYLDRKPEDDDYQNLNEIAGYIMGDINFDSSDELCYYDLSPVSNLNNLDTFIYMRREVFD